MKQKTFLFTILVFTIFQCSSNQKQTDKCKINNEKSARCEMEYYLDDDIYHLDSALYYINEVFDECESYSFILGMRKVVIYSMKHEYEKVIKFIDTLENKKLLYHPYQKNLLINRFNAMIAQEAGDTIKRNIYIKNIVSDVEQFMVMHKDTIELFFQMPYGKSKKEMNEIQIRYSLVPVQYYYYKSQIEGVEKVNAELDSLKNAICIDEGYFEVLKLSLEGDFMRFIGI
jgi:hypothetical protein